jgi:ATP-dependent Clp protease ATP-binding subunit ClpX
MDKWAHRVNHHTGRLDTAIQSEFLKIVEGCKVYVTDSEDETGVLFDTSRVLIICAGAFVGLAKQVLRRMERDDSFLSSDNFWQLIEQSDFVKYGLIPELAGRLSRTIFLRPLRKDHLAQIILLPNGPIEELRSRFEELDCEWDVTPEAITQLADIALRREVGARGLDSVLWSVFNEALYKAAASQGQTRVSLRPNQNKASISALES